MFRDYAINQLTGSDSGCEIETVNEININVEHVMLPWYK